MKNLFAYLTNIMAWITEVPKTGKVKIHDSGRRLPKAGAIPPGSLAAKREKPLEYAFADRL